MPSSPEAIEALVSLLLVFRLGDLRRLRLLYRGAKPRKQDFNASWQGLTASKLLEAPQSCIFSLHPLFSSFSSMPGLEASGPLFKDARK